MAASRFAFFHVLGVGGRTCRHSFFRPFGILVRCLIHPWFGVLTVSVLWCRFGCCIGMRSWYLSCQRGSRVFPGQDTFPWLSVVGVCMNPPFETITRAFIDRLDRSIDRSIGRKQRRFQFVCFQYAMRFCAAGNSRS